MSNKAPSSTASRGVLAHAENPPAAVASRSLAQCIAPEPAAPTSCGAAPGLLENTTWRPRIGASHPCMGANGTWYMRLVVPAHIRARHPSQTKGVLFDDSQRHQVLLFTCHPNLWRDLGAPVRTIPAIRDPAD